jgi:hypothetical protein
VSTDLTIKIADKALGREDYDAMIELRAEEATDTADAVSLTFRTDPSAEGEWRCPLDPLVTPRTPLAVTLRRPSGSYRFVGVSAEAGWSLDVTGSSRLTVKAIDRTADLDAEEKVVAWPGVADSGIAEAVYGDHGLGIRVQATPKGPDPNVHVAIQRATDWAFLRALAAKWGYAAYLEADGPVVSGHFHPLDTLAEPQAELSLGFGGDADRAEVQARLLAGQRVTAARVPPLSASPQSFTADGTDEAQDKIPLGGEVDVLLAPTDVDGEVEPEQAARGLARRSAFAVTLTATVDAERIGLLRARRTLLVKGLGSVLSGLYLVDTVRHVVNLGGHMQELTLVRNALGRVAGRPL